MAYQAISVERYPDGLQGAKYTYLCQSTADIADLPTGSSNAGEQTPGPGSLAYIETDSTARYILTINREWSEYPMSSGGGGGTGTEAFVVTYTITPDAQTQTYTATCDKTYAEIMAAIAAKSVIAAYFDMGGVISPVILTASTQDSVVAWYYEPINMVSMVFEVEHSTEEISANWGAITGK